MKFGDRMSKTRENHYVPQWYQKGFMSGSDNQLQYLDLTPDKMPLPNGQVITLHSCRSRPTSKCFVERDLYSTFLGASISDEIESKLFGEIDYSGAPAIRAFTQDDPDGWHHHFESFFTYIDAQKIRTPKGLSWIKQHYSGLDQNALMYEMQGVRNMHCTIWTEGVREIVSAENSEVKFIISDHPVTTYNYALSPDTLQCKFPNDPDVMLKATQTIFPLDMNHCLILTNLEYARETDSCDPLGKRTFAKHNRHSLVRTDQFITSRVFDSREVCTINSILKARARRYIAAGEKEWLYPEEETNLDWSSHRQILLPPKEGFSLYGGETYIGYEDGHTDYQDEFGRKTPENKYLRKSPSSKKLKPKALCGCGSGRQFRHCCKDKDHSQRPSWNVLSIRERNLAFCRGVRDVIGLHEGKDWNDVRKDFSAEKVKKIHEFYSFFWPSETDLLDLLPKPDKRLRAVYTGIVDPRVISQNAVSLSLYFDEIFIQSPFMNPNCVNPKFNPIAKPDQYRRETLKNVFLLLELEPFIEAGFINFIPDICNFDIHLQRQMLDMAEQRSKLLPVMDEDVELAKKLQMSDLKRSLYMLPKEVLIDQIKRDGLGDDENFVEDVLQYVDDLIAQDPLALLEDGDQKEKREHMIGSNISPNFEISLFLAQVTGSVVLTDNRYRWKEILHTQATNFYGNHSEWDNLLTNVNSIKFPINAHIFRTLDLRLQGKFERMRLALKNLCRILKSDVPHNKRSNVAKKIISQLQSAQLISYKENDTPPSHLAFERFYSKEMQSQCSLRFFSPKGGIQHHNTQRMLLSRGGLEHLDRVAIAIFIEHEWTYDDLEIFN